MSTVYNDRTTTELIDDAAEAIRGVCHLTFNPGSLPYPSDAYNALAGLATLAARMGQTAGQLDGIVAAWVDAHHMAVDVGDFAGDPEAAAAATSVHLDEARAALNEAGVALQRAQAALSGASWAGPDSE